MTDIRLPYTTPSPNVTKITLHQVVCKLLVKPFPSWTSHHLRHGKSHCWQLVNQGATDARHWCSTVTASSGHWGSSEHSLFCRLLVLSFARSLTLHRHNPLLTPGATSSPRQYLCNDAVHETTITCHAQWPSTKTNMKLLQATTNNATLPLLDANVPVLHGL